MKEFKFNVVCIDDETGNRYTDTYTVMAESQDDAFNRMYDLSPINFELIQLVETSGE